MNYKLFFLQNRKSMADINIEKKKSSKPIWPWILGALVLIGVIWAIAEMGDPEPETAEVAVVEEQYVVEEETQEEPVVTDPQANPVAGNLAVPYFVTFVNDNEIKERMAMDNLVTGEALVRLSLALEGIIQEDNAFIQQINEIRQTGQEIQSTSPVFEQTDKVKDAFMNAANILRHLQENEFPDAQSEVEELQERARELDAGQQLSEQKEKVEGYFEKAADALEEMEEGQAATM